MPYYETIDQKLPIGFNFKHNWYDTAIVREMIASDTQLLGSAEAKNNPIKGITALLSELIIGFKNNENPDQEIIKPVTREMAQNMYIADRDMCLLASRKLSFGSDIPITFRCPNDKCNQMVVFDFDLSVIKTKFSEDFPPNLEYPVKLEKGYQVNQDQFLKTYVLTHLKGKDQEKISQMAKSNMAQGATAALYMSIKDVPGFDLSQKSPLLVDTLRAKDLNTLVDEFGKIELGPKLIAEVKCGFCELETFIPLDQRILSFAG